MLQELLQPEIEELIKEKKWDYLKEILSLWNEVETANLITTLKSEDKYKVFIILPKEYYTKVFTELIHKDQQSIIKNMPNFLIKDLLENIDPDDRTSFLSSLNKEDLEETIKLLNPEDREIASWLLSYPEGTIGRLMTTKYISIMPHWNIKQAFKYVRNNIDDAETYTTLYVVDNKRTLMGSISIRKIFFTEQDEIISNIIDTCPYISAHDNQEDAIEIIKKYNIHSLAVVDNKHSLIGIVTVDDILDIAEEEYTEDFHKMAGITPTEDDINDNLKVAPIFSIYKKRISWLLSLVFINILSGGIISIFQNTLQVHIILVSFLPLLIGSGGNAGSQTATLVIRSLAVGDIFVRDWFAITKKDIIVSSMLGLTMATAAYLLGIIRSEMNIAFIVAVSMFSIVFIGSLIGTILPFILTKFKLDPAISGAPVLTSICDIIGTAIYCAIATIIFMIIN